MHAKYKIIKMHFYSPFAQFTIPIKHVSYAHTTSNISLIQLTCNWLLKNSLFICSSIIIFFLVERVTCANDPCLRKGVGHTSYHIWRPTDRPNDILDNYLPREWHFIRDQFYYLLAYRIMFMMTYQGPPPISHISRS